MKVLFFLLCLVMIWDSAIAGGLSAPIDVEDAAVLPKGVRSPRLRQYVIDLQNKIGDNRVSAPLAKSLNRKLSWGEVLASRQGHEKDLLEASLKAQGFNLKNSGPGSLAADINVNLDIKAPVFGYGLTKKTSVGIVVPIYTVKTSVATNFVPNAQGKAWMKSLPPSKQKAAMQSLTAGLSNKLANLGYKPLESEEFTEVGDIYFVHKYQFFKNENHGFLWRNILVAPTGRQADPDKLVDVATGDGQWDLLTGVNYDYSANIPYVDFGVTYNLYAAYNYQFADSVDKRIPEQAGSPLSVDKENVDRKLGDQIKAGVGMMLGKSNDGSNFGLSYDYQYMLPTKYEGSLYSQERYNWLEDLEKEAELQSATFIYSYSTVGKYRRKQFAIPLKALLSYARPISGRNVNDAEVYFGELTVYF